VSVAATVICETVGCPASLVPGQSRDDDPVVFVGTEERRREQLRITAIAGHVIDIDRRGTIAIRTIHRAEQVTTLVDLERLPRIQHRWGGEISGRGVTGGL